MEWTQFDRAITMASSFVICILVASVPCWGRDDFVPGSRYTSARAAALGDAFLPLGDDTASSLFYNPAAIGRVLRPQTEGINFQLYGNNNYLGSFGIDNLNSYKVFGLSGYSPTLLKYAPAVHSVGAAILPGFSTPGFGIGILMQSQLTAHGNPGDTVSYRSLYQFIPALSVGAKLARGIVRVGYSLQWVNQAVGTVENVSASDETIAYRQNLLQGAGFSHQLGFSLTLPIRFLPAFNLVARNVFGTSYESSSLIDFSPSSSGIPAHEPMTLDAAFSIQPKLGGGAYLNLVLEDRDVTNQSGMSFLGRLAVGAEFSFRDQFFLRAGWGSGYPSLGLGLTRKSGGELSVAWHSVEVGSGYHSVRDTRYLLQYQLRSF